MKIETIESINEGNADKILGQVRIKYRKVIKFGRKTLTVEQCLKQYDPNQHDVQDPVLRKDKRIQVPADDNDENSEATRTEIVKVNRVSTTSQRLIVKRHVAFLTGGGLQFVADPKEDEKQKTLIEALKRVNENVKMDYLNTEIGEIMCSETHCAELWYIVANGLDDDNDFEGIAFDSEFSLRCKILAKSKGDDLYPIFDSMGDMIAFVREYVDDDDDDNPANISTVYTKDYIITVVKSRTKGGGTTVTRLENAIGKIPVIYYSQPAPEWLDVQSSITRKELLMSNTGDSNDYYSSPTTVVSGDIKGFNKKGETGKVLEVGRDASVTLLEAKNGVESVRFEKEMLDNEILTGSQTPDISFESMKGLGTFSGFALEMLFYDASLKVKGKLPTYGLSKQRSINFQKAALAQFDVTFKQAARMPIKPKIEAYMPKSVQELIEMLNLATGGTKAIMSVDTAVNLNPLVEDKEGEKLALAKEADDAAKAAQQQAMTI